MTLMKIPILFIFSLIRDIRDIRVIRGYFS
jgi:hypothetical protein